MTHSEPIVNLLGLMQELIQEHNGKWVLLSEDKDRVLYSSMTKKDVLEQSRLGDGDWRVVRVPGDSMELLREL
jgi:hypothetical protein